MQYCYFNQILIVDKIIVDRECINEFEEIRLVMFVLLYLNKIKCFGSNVIKFEKIFIKKEKVVL